MENIQFRLRRHRRRDRRKLIHFMEALFLHLQAGYDLGYSWLETQRSLGSEAPTALTEGPEGLSRQASSGWLLDEVPVLTWLTHLSERYPEPGHRVWFTALRDLYSSGAPLAPAVQAIASTLRKEQERELEVHCRTLPGKVNVLLILFFLPPTLALIFIPLVLEILSGFPG